MIHHCAACLHVWTGEMVLSLRISSSSAGGRPWNNFCFLCILEAWGAANTWCDYGYSLCPGMKHSHVHVILLSNHLITEKKHKRFSDYANEIKGPTTHTSKYLASAFFWASVLSSFACQFLLCSLAPSRLWPPGCWFVSCVQMVMQWRMNEELDMMWLGMSCPIWKLWLKCDWYHIHIIYISETYQKHHTHLEY